MSLLGDVRQVAQGWRWTRQSLVPRSAASHALPRPTREFPTAWARTPAARVARSVILRYGFAPLIQRETEPNVYGLDKLAGLDEPVVFCANHASHLDAPMILCALPPALRERVAVGAAADYFFDARWRAAGTALAFNTFPVDRRGGARGASTAERLLTDGWSLLVFPEGTRSPDGWVGRFRHGAAHLCCRHRTPAVPLAIRGSYAAMPRGRAWPLPGRLPVSVRFGAPLVPGADEAPRAFSGKLAQAVSQLWDEDQSCWYASLRRATDDETPLPSGPDAAEWRRIWEASRALPRRERPSVWDDA